MSARQTIQLLGTCLVVFMFGCATGISGQARSQVTYHGTFAELQGDVDRHAGEVVILGGKVVETKGWQTASEITVLQLPLDRSSRPEDGDRSDGRYLVRSEEFLDPAVYEKGVLITVVGKMIGSEVRSVGGFQYVYVVLEPVEIKVWPPREKTSPSFHLGIGVGKSF